MKRHLALLVSIGLSVALLYVFLWHQRVSQMYPYYFMWDMDQTVAIDTLLINSNMLPDLMVHPGFGMNLVLSLSTAAARTLDIVSIANMQELAASLNPLSAMAELTDFQRAHSPLVVFFTVCMFAMAVRHKFKLGYVGFAFCAIFMGVEESLIYQSAMIRSELYSILFWGAAVWTLAGTGSAETPRMRCTLAAASGVLLGLTFQTKVQALLYLIAAATFFLLVLADNESCRPGNDEHTRSSHISIPIKALTVFNIVLFVILMALGLITPIPKGIPAWETDLGVNHLCIAFLLCLMFLCLASFFHRRTPKYQHGLAVLIPLFSLIVTGFLVSFLAHFALLDHGTVSFKYMLLVFKMLFLRSSDFLSARPLSDGLTDAIVYVRLNPMPFISHFLLWALVLVGRRRGWIRIPGIQLWLYALLSLLGLVNVVVAARSFLRDDMWREILVNLTNLMLFFAIISGNDKRPRCFRFCGLLIVLTLFGFNFVHAQAMPSRLDANDNHRGFAIANWFHGVYAHNHPRYTQIMQREYDQQRAGMAATASRQHRDNRRTANFVFKNQRITHRNIGVLSEGFRVWSSRPDTRISSVPPVLRGATVVDNADMPTLAKYFFVEEQVRKKSYYFDKVKKKAPDNHIVVLNRMDLQIFLFVREPVAQFLIGEDIEPLPLKVTVQSPSEKIELSALLVKNYKEIPVQKLGKESFFAIRRLF